MMFCEIESLFQMKQAFFQSKLEIGQIGTDRVKYSC